MGDTIQVAVLEGEVVVSCGLVKIRLTQAQARTLAVVLARKMKLRVNDLFVTTKEELG